MSDEKDIAQAKLAALDFPLGIYRHYKGGLYVVFAVSVDEDTLTPLVHYFSRKKRTRWTRTVDNFSGGPEPGHFGEFDVRFTFVRPASFEDMSVAIGAF